MKAEQAKKIADQAIAQLAEALKKGRSQELLRYLSMLARFHRYSFGNVMMILAQKPDAIHVAGFSTWKQMGRYVRKGERGIVILAPMVIRNTDDQLSDSDRQQKPKMLFRGVYVFDVAQTEGEPLPEPARVNGDPGRHLDRLKAVIAARGIQLDNADVPMGAEGVSRGGRISVQAGLPPAQEFSVIAHELAHELLHKGENRPESKTVRETEAEAVAFVVCSSVGLETGTAASDYIQLYDGNTETLTSSLDRVQKIAAEIITALSAPNEPPDTVATAIASQPAANATQATRIVIGAPPVLLTDRVGTASEAGVCLSSCL